MKKSILLILTLLTSNLIFTQNKLNYGFYSGINFSNFRGSDAENYKTKTGFHLGFFLEPKIIEKTTIETGVYYSIMGANFSETNTYFDIDGSHLFTNSGTYKTNYLRVPIILKYYPIENLSLGLGVDAGINVVRNFKYDEHINSGSELEVTVIQGVDAGLKTKISYKLHKNIFISADYYHGLIKTFKNINIITPSKTTTIEAQNIYNSNIAFSVGYIF